MSDEKTGPSKINELNFRRGLAREIILAIDNISIDELSFLGFTVEQKQSAMQEYKRQLAEIDKKIETLTGKPPDISVGLKTAVLFAKSVK